MYGKTWWGERGAGPFPPDLQYFVTVIFGNFRGFRGGNFEKWGGGLCKKKRKVMKNTKE